MALKKVRRPVLHGEKEYLEKKGWNNVMDARNELEETTNDLQNEWNSPILQNQSNVHNTDLEIDADTIDEDEAEFEPKKALGESALNRTISFLEDSVRLPRKPKVEQGNYSFRIDNITSKENIVGKFGAYDQFLIAFSLYKIGIDVPIQITIPYIISSKPESPLMLFLASFKSIFNGQNITITQLVGLQGTCVVSHYETALGDIYERLLVKNVE
ncbi:hypothetical protein [Oceanobacillus damuensis]|uniref:hypothetical protein n=1 Tax=Oceanobacillus damuensis TaxID=937928 RepID=UPI000831C70C|nr:hypothetical protein [Oceanobacillus damuensis]